MIYLGHHITKNPSNTNAMSYPFQFVLKL